MIFKNFYFEIILELQKGCKNSPGSWYIPFNLPPFVNIFCNHSVVTETRRLIIKVFIRVSALLSFFWSRIQTSISYHVY